jgi:hypothetical protein
MSTAANSVTCDTKTLGFAAKAGTTHRTRQAVPGHSQTVQQRDLVISRGEQKGTLNAIRQSVDGRRALRYARKQADCRALTVSKSKVHFAKLTGAQSDPYNGAHFAAHRIRQCPR